MKRILFSIYYFLFTGLAFAQDKGGRIGFDTKEDGFSLPNPLKVGTLVELIDRVIFYLTIIASPIVAIMVIVGAFQILTAAGDPEKFKTGKKTILYAAIGFAIILVARGLIAIIQNLLGVQETIPTQSAF